MLAAQGLAVATLAGDTGFQEVTRLVAGIAVVGIMAYCVVALCPGQRQAAAQDARHSVGWKVFRTFSAANPMFRRSSADDAPPNARKSEMSQRESELVATTTAPKRDDRTMTFTDSTHNVTC